MPLHSDPGQDPLCSGIVRQRLILANGGGHTVDNIMAFDWFGDHIEGGCQRFSGDVLCVTTSPLLLLSRHRKHNRNAIGDLKACLLYTSPSPRD